MAGKLTPIKAAGYLRYCEETLAAGRYVSPDHKATLEAKAQHFAAFIVRSKCCVKCGTPLSREDSIAEWEKNGHIGPVCVQKEAA